METSSDVAARGPGLARALNDGCHCMVVDPGSVAVAPELFAREPVFVARAETAVIREFVARFEATVRDPDYVAQALTRAGASAEPDFGPRGLFTTFDFHLGDDGPKLIEINTNGGGALLAVRSSPWATIDALIDPFAREWALQRGDAPMGRIAIVDDEPETQPLFVEMQAIAHHLRQRDWDADVVAASDLSWDGARLGAHGRPIDFVYNRITDFCLDTHPELRAAYLADAVVVSPHPRAHALYADKRNLVWLAAHRPDPVLPAAHAIGPELWERRKQLFFKPVAGFGSRAVYSGAKLTRKTWSTILDAPDDWIAQELVEPSRRAIVVDENIQHLKVDVRAYSYAGEVLLLAARLYRGQVTNMRTPGGGFAPVVEV